MGKFKGKGKKRIFVTKRNLFYCLETFYQTQNARDGLNGPLLSVANFSLYFHSYALYRWSFHYKITIVGNTDFYIPIRSSTTKYYYRGSNSRWNGEGDIRHHQLGSPPHHNILWEKRNGSFSLKKVRDPTK